MGKTNFYYRIKIIAWTASFRYPIFISGTQPTLPIPPYSTIYGLISAACGKWITPEDLGIRYVFKSEAKGVDLETIYELSGKTPLQAKSNVVKREFLLNPTLYLYLQDKGIANCFRKPYYPLLLGRSTELASVEEIKYIYLEESTRFRLGGTILRFPPLWNLNGIIQALPTHFTASYPRKPLGTRPFFLVKDFQNYEGKGLVDEEMDWGVIIEQEKNEGNLNIWGY